MQVHETRQFLIDADTDARAAVYYGNGWRCVDTMPASGKIEVLTVKGFVRSIDTAKTREPIRSSGEKGPRCIRINTISAVAWRDPEARN